MDDVINCSSCGGETPANVGVCLQCFTNLDAIGQTSDAPVSVAPPTEAPRSAIPAPPAPGPAAAPAPVADDDEDKDGYDSDGPGLLFPWGWQPVGPDRPLEIGRETAVPLPEVASHGNISRLHARIERTGRGLSLTDLGSTNGTFLNGRRLAPHVATEAQAGDLIRFAATLEAIVDDEDPGL